MRSRKASMQIKKKVFNEYVLPVMTYGSETWALTTAQMDALAVAQRKNGENYAGHHPSQPET